MSNLNEWLEVIAPWGAGIAMLMFVGLLAWSCSPAESCRAFTEQYAACQACEDDPSCVLDFDDFKNCHRLRERVRHYCDR